MLMSLKNLQSILIRIWHRSPYTLSPIVRSVSKNERKTENSKFPDKNSDFLIQNLQNILKKDELDILSKCDDQVNVNESKNVDWDGEDNSICNLD